jgi:Flp pilus assembly protein TadD
MLSDIEQPRQQLEDSPNDPDALMRQGASLLQQGECEAAEQAYRRAIELAPARPALHAALG